MLNTKGLAKLEAAKSELAQLQGVAGFSISPTAAPPMFSLPQAEPTTAAVSSTTPPADEAAEHPPLNDALLQGALAAAVLTDAIRTEVPAPNQPSLQSEATTNRIVILRRSITMAKSMELTERGLAKLAAAKIELAQLTNETVPVVAENPAGSGEDSVSAGGESVDGAISSQPVLEAVDAEDANPPGQEALGTFDPLTGWSAGHQSDDIAPASPPPSSLPDSAYSFAGLLPASAALTGESGAAPNDSSVDAVSNQLSLQMAAQMGGEGDDLTAVGCVDEAGWTDVKYGSPPFEACAVVTSDKTTCTDYGDYSAEVSRGCPWSCGACGTATFDGTAENSTGDGATGTVGVSVTDPAGSLQAAVIADSLSNLAGGTVEGSASVPAPLSSEPAAGSSPNATEVTSSSVPNTTAATGATAASAVGAPANETALPIAVNDPTAAAAAAIAADPAMAAAAAIAAQIVAAADACADEVGWKDTQYGTEPFGDCQTVAKDAAVCTDYGVYSTEARRACKLSCRQCGPDAVAPLTSAAPGVKSATADAPAVAPGVAALAAIEAQITANDPCKDDAGWKDTKYGTEPFGDCATVAEDPKACKDYGVYSTEARRACPRSCAECGPGAPAPIAAAVPGVEAAAAVATTPAPMTMKELQDLIVAKKTEM